MKGTVNKTILLGRLGKDPEIRDTQTGMVVANFSIATNDKVKEEVTTDWHNVVAFGKLAEIIQKYVRKGSLVYIEGKSKTNKYTDKNGIERYKTDIIANSLQMLGGRGDDKPQEQPFNNDYAKAKGQKPSHNVDDEIPF